MSHLLVSMVWFWIRFLHIDFVINFISFDSLQAMLYASLTIFLVEETSVNIRTKQDGCSCT